MLNRMSGALRAVMLCLAFALAGIAPAALNCVITSLVYSSTFFSMAAASRSRHATGVS